MDKFHMFILVFLSVALLSKNTIANYDVKEFSLLMPNVKPSRPELYLCTAAKIDYTENYYMIGFVPNAKMDTAHHMLVYGCGAPGSQAPVWNCGEMAKTEKDDEVYGSPCSPGSHSQIIYAWARDAPTLNLPEGVGFKVGRNSPIKYLVVQVHYAHIHQFADGKTDNSGVKFLYTLKTMKKRAGVILLGTGGMIPPMKTEKMETVCSIKEKKTIYPFAYRTHTHSLGKVVSGYKVRRDKNGVDHWTLLGKRDPLTPQMFYPMENKDPIEYQDRLAARCTMKSDRPNPTYIGGTNDDEMCNFYLMYYVDNDEPLNMKYCFSPGPPKFYWTDPKTDLNNIPDEEASFIVS